MSTYSDPEPPVDEEYILNKYLELLSLSKSLIEEIDEGLVSQGDAEVEDLRDFLEKVGKL